MCLEVVSTNWTYEQKERTFYKVLLIREGKLCSPYYSYEWKVGENEVQFAPPNNNYFYSGDGNFQRLVFQGLHVFEVLSNAEVVRKSIQIHRDCDCVVVKLTGKKADFIAAGYVDAAFTKLTLSQEEYDNVLASNKNDS